MNQNFDNYENLNTAYQHKQNAKSTNILINDAIDGGKDSINSFANVALGIVESIIKDIMQHLPSSCSELAQLNKFIDEHPDKAMQGLQTTLG